MIIVGKIVNCSYRCKLISVGVNFGWLIAKILMVVKVIKVVKIHLIMFVLTMNLRWNRNY